MILQFFSVIFCETCFFIELQNRTLKSKKSLTSKCDDAATPSHTFLSIRLLYWTLNISQTASYEVTYICLFACLSVRPSLSFIKIGSLVFSNIVHDDG